MILDFKKTCCTSLFAVIHWTCTSMGILYIQVSWVQMSFLWPNPNMSVTSHIAIEPAKRPHDYRVNA